MSFYFLREWSQFDPKKWVRPNIDSIKMDRSTDCDIASVTLPIFLEISKTATLSEALTLILRENRIKRIESLNCLDTTKHEKLKKINWDSETIVEDLRAIDPLCAEIYQKEFTPEEEKAEHEVLLASEKSDDIFDHAIRCNLRHDNERYVECLKKLMIFPDQREKALRLLLIHYKETSCSETNFSINIEWDKPLESETVLFLILLEIQLLIRKKMYDEALARIEEKKKIDPNNALFDGLAAQALLGKHTSGQSIAKACDYMESALKKAKDHPMTIGWMLRDFTDIKVGFAVFMGHPTVKEGPNNAKMIRSWDFEKADLEKAGECEKKGDDATAIVHYEHYFFAMWANANPYSFTGDRPLDVGEQISVKSYVKVLFRIYKGNFNQVHLHLQKLLDSFPIPTRWKQSFAEIAKSEGLYETFLSPSGFIKDTFTKLADSVKSLEKIATQSLENFNKSKPLPPGLKSNWLKRIQTSETIAQYVNLFGTNPPKPAPKGRSFHQEVTDTFINEFKRYLRSLIEDFYKQNKEGFEEVSFNGHYKKAKSEKNVDLVMMHFIRMRVMQTGKESTKIFEDITSHMEKLISGKPEKSNILLLLCLFSINEKLCDFYYPQLNDHFPLEILLLKGFNHFRENSIGEALEDFKNAYKLDSTHPLVLLGLATCRFCNKELGLAAMSYQKLIKLDQRLANEAALYALSCLKDLEDIDSIKNFLFGLKGYDFAPSREVQILARELFFDLLTKEGRFAECLDWLKQFALSEPNDPFILMNHACQLMNKANEGESIVEAESLFKKALRHFDKNEWPASLKVAFSSKHAFYLGVRLKTAEAWEVAKDALQYTSNDDLLSYELQHLIIPSEKGKFELSKFRKVAAKGINENSNNSVYLLLVCWCWTHSPKFDLNKTIALLQRAILKDPSGQNNAHCLIAMVLAIIYSKGISHVHPDLLNKLTDAVLGSDKGGNFLTTLFDESFSVGFEVDLYAQWLKKYHDMPFAFTSFAELVNGGRRQPSALKKLKEMESEFPKNRNLLTAIAMLETSGERKHYIELCLSVDPNYEPLCCLLARQLFAENKLEALEEFERSFRFCYKKTQPDFYFGKVKLPKEASLDISSYVATVFRKYRDALKAKDHIKEFLANFTEESDWLTSFLKLMDESVKQIIPKMPTSKRQYRVHSKDDAPPVQAAAAAIQPESAIAPAPIAAPPQLLVKQEQGIPKGFLEPDEEEVKLRKKLIQEREESRQSLLKMLDISTIHFECSRWKEEDIIKNAREIAKRHQVIQEENTIPPAQVKLRKRPTLVEQDDVVLPIATTILTAAKLAASSMLSHPEVFTLIPDKEKDRLNQIYSNLSVIEGQLKRVEKPEYHPDVQEFIMLRAMMYQLLRLGEGLFPQSASVRRMLCQHYPSTMEKLISSKMIPVIRNQLRHEFIAVTLSKIVHTSKYLINSTLKQNLKLWYDFNQKPHKVSALIKTDLPESCLLVDNTIKTLPMVFLVNELRKLSSLLDKLSSDVLAMNPDVVNAVKMSICILCEIAKWDEFRGKIKGLDKFIRAGNQIAHEFGEDCAYYSFDEISLFDIKPYVRLAGEVLEANFPKSTGGLRANAQAFVMGKKS